MNILSLDCEDFWKIELYAQLSVGYDLQSYSRVVTSRDKK